MNKYYTGNYGGTSLDAMLMPDESIIWRGSPKKSAFVLNSSLKMAPFAILWMLVDGFIIGSMVASGTIGEMLFFIIPFFLIHLAPVWIWFFNIFTAAGRWKNTEYAVTNKRILLRNGLIGYEFNSVYYTDIAHVALQVGAIDRMLGVGDIHILLQNGISTKNDTAVMLDLENAQEAFAIVQRTVMDIQTDIHYPNAMRPEHNPGYQTTYTPNDSNR